MMSSYSFMDHELRKPYMKFGGKQNMYGVFTARLIMVQMAATDVNKIHAKTKSVQK